MDDDMHRIIQLESAQKKTEDSQRRTENEVLLLNRDLHTIKESIESIASSMSILVSVQMNQAVIEERIDSRHEQQKFTNKKAFERIEGIEEDLSKFKKSLEIVGFFSKHPRLMALVFAGIYILFTMDELRSFLFRSIGLL